MATASLRRFDASASRNGHSGCYDGRMRAQWLMCRSKTEIDPRDNAEIIFWADRGQTCGPQGILERHTRPPHHQAVPCLCKIWQIGLAAACAVARLSSILFVVKSDSGIGAPSTRSSPQLSILATSQFTQCSDMPDTQLLF